MINMPILPAHVGPPLFIGALVGRKLNLTVLVTSSLLIDIEAIFWGTIHNEHGYLHTFGGATLFGIFYGFIFFILLHIFWKWRDYKYPNNEMLQKKKISN